MFFRTLPFDLVHIMGHYCVRFDTEKILRVQLIIRKVSKRAIYPLDV